MPRDSRFTARSVGKRSGMSLEQEIVYSPFAIRHLL